MGVIKCSVISLFRVKWAIKLGLLRSWIVVGGGFSGLNVGGWICGYVLILQEKNRSTHKTTLKEKRKKKKLATKKKLGSYQEVAL